MYADCEICRCYRVISHSSQYDITKHIGTKKHVKKESSCSSSSRLDVIFKNDSTQNDVTKAEAQ